MADAALFIGWGEPVRGREVEAVKAFEDAQEFWTRLQEHGDIESFESVLLAPHGPGLKGFTLLRGTPEQLFALQTSEEFVAVQMRVRLVVDDLEIVNALIGAGMTRRMAIYHEQIAAVHG